MLIMFITMLFIILSIISIIIIIIVIVMLIIRYDRNISAHITYLMTYQHVMTNATRAQSCP